MIKNTEKNAVQFRIHPQLGKLITTHECGKKCLYARLKVLYKSTSD